MGDEYNQNSLLTKSLRQYLQSKARDEVELDAPHERITRKRLRERVRAGVFDFELLVRHWNTSDREAAFKNLTTTTIQNLVISIIGFLYLLTDDRCVSPAGEDEQWKGRMPDPDSAFAWLAELGIKAALVHDGFVVNDVSVSVEVDRGGRLAAIPTDDLSGRTMVELYDLRLAGEITQDEFADAVYEKRGEENPANWRVE